MSSDRGRGDESNWGKGEGKKFAKPFQTKAQKGNTDTKKNIQGVHEKEKCLSVANLVKKGEKPAE